jgi:hypothetical protein
MSTSDSENRTLSKNEKQTLHEDTQSLSDAYSQGFVPKLLLVTDDNFAISTTNRRKHYLQQATK